MLGCPRCGRALDPRDADLAEVHCYGCGSRLELRTYPALRRAEPAGSKGELLDDESEAACFKHSNKKAIAHCSKCGRFLCALCEVELGDETVCFDCFAEGAREGAGELERKAVVWDSVALSLAIIPILLWFVTVVTAPLTLFIVARYWKNPGGLVPRTRIRFIAAGGIALLQLAGWGLLAASVIASGALTG